MKNIRGSHSPSPMEPLSSTRTVYSLLLHGDRDSTACTQSLDLFADSLHIRVHKTQPLPVQMVDPDGA
jgi:hypothetical protein